MRLSAAVALTFAVALLTSVSAQAQGLPPTVTGVAPPTPISAYNGQLVWSQPASNGQYQLVSRTGSGPVTPLPIATRGVPFDVDLGPTSSGGLYALYSRCTTEPQWDQVGMPDYQTGKGCAIYKFDFGSNQEVRYSKVNASNASQYWPTYWKGKVGFARTYASNPNKGYVYTKTISSSTPSAQMPIGALGDTSAYATQLELYGSRLAFGWTYTTEQFMNWQLRLDTIGSKGSTVLDQTKGGQSNVGLGWPAFGYGGITWLRYCIGDPGSCPGAVRIQRSTYSGSGDQIASTGEFTQAYDFDSSGSVTYLENDVLSLYQCQTDPATTPACTITATQPQFTNLS